MCEKWLKSIVGILVLGLFVCSVQAAEIPEVTPGTEEGLIANQAITAPVIDGDLSDWIAAGAEFMAYEDANSLLRGHDTWGGPSDLSARWSMMWDDTNLYLSAVVWDDVLTAAPSFGQAWKGDCIFLYIDADSDGTVDNHANILLFQDVNDVEPVAYVLDWTNGRVPYENGQAAIVLDPTLGDAGRFIEVAIPRAAIADVGSTGGFMLQVGFEEGNQAPDGGKFMSWKGVEPGTELFPLTLDNHPIVLEDFEGDLSAWNMDASDANLVSIGEDPLDPNNGVLQMLPTNMNGGLYLPWVVGPDERQTLSFKMLSLNLADVYSSNMGMGVADEAGIAWGNMYSIVRMGEGTNLSYRDGDAYVTYLEVAEILKWYTMIMDLDMPNQTYDLYIDDVLVKAGAAFRSSDPNGVAKVMIRHSNKMTDCAVYIDDIVAGAPAPKLEWELYSEDFNESLANWTAEKENESTTVTIVDGKLDINTVYGSTVWFNHKLSGNIKIEYDVTTLGDGQDKLPRDHNLFWMAHNPEDPDVQPAGTGNFGSYDRFDLYYAGIGGNYNRTTRFRRYSNSTREMLQEYTDAAHLNTAGQTYHMTIICKGSHIQVYRDGEIFWDFIDPQPYTEGWFGFRQTRTHLQMDNFIVYGLNTVVSEGE